MKYTLIIIALAISSVAYSKTPELPKPQEGKYAVQIIKVLTSQSIDPLPNKTDNALGPMKLAGDGYVVPAESIPLPDASKILEAPDTEIVEYPILYTEAGSSVTNDQTKTVMFPEDFEIKDGKAIPKEKPVKLGLSIATAITAREGNIVDLKLNFYKNDLKGYDEYTVGNGVKAKMPVFERRKFDTDVSVPLGQWMIMGGLKNEDKSKNRFYLIRVI